jgi:hypothetical protein
MDRVVSTLITISGMSLVILALVVFFLGKPIRSSAAAICWIISSGSWMLGFLRIWITKQDLISIPGAVVLILGLANVGIFLVADYRGRFLKNKKIRLS